MINAKQSNETESSEILERLTKIASRRGFRAGLIGGLVPFIALIFLGATKGTLDALFIDQNGRVGINTNEPKAYLDVNGKAKVDTLEVNESLYAKEVDVSGSTRLHDVQVDGPLKLNDDLYVKGRKQALGKVRKLGSYNEVGKGKGGNYQEILFRQNGDSVKSDGFVSVIANVGSSNFEAFFLRGWLRLDANDSIAAGGAACNAVNNQDYPIMTNSFVMPVRKGQEWWIEYYQTIQRSSNTSVNIFWTPLTE